MAGTVQDQAQLSADLVLLENLLAGHKVNHFELHEQCVEKLRVAAMKDLPARGTFLDDPSVLAVR